MQPVTPDTFGHIKKLRNAAEHYESHGSWLVINVVWMTQPTHAVLLGCHDVDSGVYRAVLYNHDRVQLDSL